MTFFLYSRNSKWRASRQPLPISFLKSLDPLFASTIYSIMAWASALMALALSLIVLSWFSMTIVLKLVSAIFISSLDKFIGQFFILLLYLGLQLLDEFLRSLQFLLKLHFLNLTSFSHLLRDLGVYFRGLHLVF